MVVFLATVVVVVVVVVSKGGWRLRRLKVVMRRVCMGVRVDFDGERNDVVIVVVAIIVIVRCWCDGGDVGFVMVLCGLIVIVV